MIFHSCSIKNGNFPSFFHGFLLTFPIDIHRQRRHVGGLRLFGVLGDLGLRAGGQDARKTEDYVGKMVNL